MVLHNENNCKSMTIGILGAPLNNGNLGCIALTYSLLTVLEKIARDLQVTFIYCIFEGIEDQEKTKLASKNLGIEFERIKSFNIYPILSVLGFFHRPNKVLNTYSALKKCNLLIDLTQGDSFSDIYGDRVFNKNTNGKLFVIKKMKKPLILGPQTYGPYLKEKNKTKAKKAIDNATLVIARDDASAQYVNSFTDRKVYVTTDLAFELPYKKYNFKQKDGADNKIISVGFNVSGLLLKNKAEFTPTKFQLQTDYDSYIDKMLFWLLDNNFKVSLIPHVTADYECEKLIAAKFPQVELVEMHRDPIDIKSRISMCDIFIGARMHATIGAFSSGVATIPTAYSRKFNGLYKSVGYPYVIDLLHNSTEENIEKTKEYVQKYTELKTLAQESMKNISVRKRQTASLIEEQIRKLI